MEHKKLIHCPICNSTDFADFLRTNDYMITQEEFQIQSCNSCGFHFTNPRPSLEVIGDYYKSEEYVSHSSSNKGLVNKLYNVIRSYTLKKKVSLMNSLTKGDSILDIGAGTGHFLNACQVAGFKTEGLEPDSDAVKFAKTNFELDLKPLSYLYEIPQASKDIISMWHVLEHVYNLKDDFKQLTSLLKNDGTLVIAVPNLESYDAKHYKSFWAAYDLPRHLYHFRKKDIQLLADQHGLKLTQVLPMKFDSFYVSMLSEKYKGGSIIKAFCIGLLSNLKSSSGGYSSQIYILKKK